MKWIRLIAGITVFLILSLTYTHPIPVLAQSTITIGTRAVGQKAFEFVGQLNQTGLDLAAYSSLSHTNGFSDDLVFTKPRLERENGSSNVYGTGNLSSRQVLKNLISTVSEVKVTVYFNATPNATPILLPKGRQSLPSRYATITFWWYVRRMSAM